MLDQFLKLTDSACSIGLTSGFSIFSLEIRWYALSYIFGLILGQIYLKNIIKLNYYNNLGEFIVSEETILKMAYSNYRE